MSGVKRRKISHDTLKAEKPTKEKAPAVEPESEDVSDEEESATVDESPQENEAPKTFKDLVSLLQESQ